MISAARRLSSWVPLSGLEGGDTTAGCYLHLADPSGVRQRPWTHFIALPLWQHCNTVYIGLSGAGLLMRYISSGPQGRFSTRPRIA